MNHRQEVIRETRKKFYQRVRLAHEVLNTPGGKQLLEELRFTAFNPPGGGIYVPDSDQTQFNLGVLFVYDMLERIQRGLTEEDSNGG